LSRLKLTEEGLTLNGQRVYTTMRVKTGDVISLRMEQEYSEDILPQPMPLDILYEDPFLLIVNKAAGIIVHPTHGHYVNTLANGIVHHWRELGETVRFRPVHRLDQDTSGIVAVAKNPYIHQQLSEQMQRGDVEKSYIAYVHSVPIQAKGTIDAPIDRNPESPHVRIVTPTGCRSVTHYALVTSYGGGKAAKVRLLLETGRTHQIRVHMQHIGCPLIGDGMYRDAALDKLDHVRLADGIAGRQALHAEMLGFTHPATGDRVRFHAGLPADLKALEDWLDTRP
jgi:23S rRNA pseudouridine1911/1915/1917 synthase